MIRISTSIIFLIFSIALLAQNALPDPGELFRDDVVPKVEIWLPQDSFNIMMANGNEQSNYPWHATFIFDNGIVQDTIENVGFRLRGNTSRNSDKKSYKVSFNTYVPGRKYYGVEKLNLNGEHNDPTIMRAKTGWDLCRDFQIPASRSNHVDFYVNGDFWGVYINVEHIDEEFADLYFGNKDGNLYKCLWPADLDYKGANPNLYKENFGGRRAYDLKTNTAEDDYTDIAHFIDVLNNTPQDEMACELEKVFNVDGYLKSMIMDILIGNWDGPLYNKNNFYLYHNTATDKFEYIPYDLDNTFGIDWFNKNWATRDIYDWGNHGQPRPLFFNIIEVPEFRAKFTYYIKEYLTNYYKSDVLDLRIDALKAQIDDSAMDDPFRPLDYGFSFQDYENSFDEDISFGHVSTSLKQFIEDRRFWALSQMENLDIHPIITEIQHNNPSELQEIHASAKIETDGDVQVVQFCYQIDNQGDVICEDMVDDGDNNDGGANDGVFGILLPPLNENAMLNYYITAVDENGFESRSPFCEDKTLFVGSSAIPLYINEFMASNTTIHADENGDYDDWIEIWSNSDVPIYLGDKFLSDNIDNPDKWQFPDIWIQPQEYLVVWADEDGNDGPMHANFKLSAGGEYIGIFDSENNAFALIDGYEFGAQTEDIAFGRLPDGVGVFQQVNATPAATNMPFNNTEDIDFQKVVVDVFPNPFSDNFKIQIENTNRKDVRIKLCNVLGNVLYENLSNEFFIDNDVNTAKFVAGTYFLAIFENQELLDKRILIKTN